MGGVLGGGTALYGAALMRPSRTTSIPARLQGERALPPLGLADRVRRSGALLHRSGAALRRRRQRRRGLRSAAEAAATGSRSAGLPLHPINQRLDGRQPPARIAAVPAAAGHRPRALSALSRLSGLHLSDRAPASSAQLLEQPDGTVPCDVLTRRRKSSGFAFDGKGEPDGIRSRRRSTGGASCIGARRYTSSPPAPSARRCCCSRSGVEHPLVGRNYMMHFSPIVDRHLRAHGWAGRDGSSSRSVSRTTTSGPKTTLTSWAWCNRCRCPDR